MAAIRSACNETIDWPFLLQIVRRHRVFGLVHHALMSAGIDVPSAVADRLASRAREIAGRNMILAGETIRLQRELEAAQIRVVVLKGIVLAQLAYGSLELKQSLDIDLLVSPVSAEAALQLLEHDGFNIVSAVEHLGNEQRRALVRFGKDVKLIHRNNNVRVDLQWQLAANPLLLQGVDGLSSTRHVALGDCAGIRTLDDDDLFAYLSVHGAHHAWSRLKWLADFNALIARKNDADIDRLYRRAQTSGAGLCAGQALLLCHRLFALKLPIALVGELQDNRSVQRLVAIALRAMARPDAASNRTMVDVIRGVHTQFLLGKGWAFFVAQCRITSVGLTDVVRVPLPTSLHFLYPILRLPLWLWRRSRRLP
jgi:Uncharacterised nucleotidyltransferase